MSFWVSGKSDITETDVPNLLQQLIEIKHACRAIKQELKTKSDLMLAAREWCKLKIRQRYLRKQHRQIEKKYISLK
ncbi:MAG: hypothetical protein WC575_04180 [Patescibacteria group bacterium]